MIALLLATTLGVWVDVPEKPSAECIKLVKKARRGYYYRQFAISMAASMASTRTINVASSTRINGQTYRTTSTVRYTDPGLHDYYTRDLQQSVGHGLTKKMQVAFKDANCDPSLYTTWGK